MSQKRNLSNKSIKQATLWDIARDVKEQTSLGMNEAREEQSKDTGEVNVLKSVTWTRRGEKRSHRQMFQSLESAMGSVALAQEAHSLPKRKHIPLEEGSGPDGSAQGAIGRCSCGGSRHTGSLPSRKVNMVMG